MSCVTDLFWQSSLQEIKQGYVYQVHTEEFICLICGQKYINGLIYKHNECLYEARKYIEIHIKEEHGSPFEFLVDLEKKLTGLTEHQKTIIKLFYEGKDDKEISQSLGTASTSTIRNHRFSLKEKQKQAKIFLAIMELLADKAPKKSNFINFPRGTKETDDRLAVTQEEYEKILAACFPKGPAGPLASFPLKEKKRVVILKNILKHFESNRKYTEKEVNEILKNIYPDYILLRRYLIEYGFMERVPDGSAYWVNL